MNVVSTELNGVLIFEPAVFRDERGQFFETWSRERYKQAGIEEDFVQDNISCSKKGVVRGLHYQYPHCQGKLVQVLNGKVFDVAVDIRVDSPDFGRWVSAELSDENYRQMYIPAGFAHGFCVLSEMAVFSYKCTDYYSPDAEKGILWNDEELGIDWPVEFPIVSQKDKSYHRLSEIDKMDLPKSGQI